MAGQLALNQPTKVRIFLPQKIGAIMEDEFKVKIMLKDFTVAVYEVKSAYLQDGLYNIILKDEIRRFSCQNILEIVENRNIV